MVYLPQAQGLVLIEVHWFSELKQLCMVITCSALLLVSGSKDMNPGLPPKRPAMYHLNYASCIS